MLGVPCVVDRIAQTVVKLTFEPTLERMRPHSIVNGKMVPNKQKNGDKYTRQIWNKTGPCIHTRNDQMASQNTLHPKGYHP